MISGMFFSPFHVAGFKKAGFDIGLQSKVNQWSMTMEAKPPPPPPVI